MKSIFDAAVSNEFIDRINKLTPETQPLWGKMSVAQMLAHCCVTYELVYENKHKKPGLFMKLILKLIVKDQVVTEKPYKQNLRTGPDFLIVDPKIFETEKTRLINFINKTTELGANHFEGKVSHSFGPLSSTEWNNMFYKHLDHHLSQFGV
jgi:hypothetical protein